MELQEILQTMVKHEASDLYLTTGAPACIKINGALKAVDAELMGPNRVKAIAYDLLSAEQIAAYERKPELNLALSMPGIGRFRVNIFQQRNQTAMVIRYIKTVIPSLEALRLPAVLTRLVMLKHGLVLFVGGTGSGKSTSMASLIDHRNTNTSGHIITIEDPIEFMHSHKKSIVNQREVGIDTDSYADALKNTLRQAPDVILIGEIRDRETMENAISFAETGHLVLSTLHANNANQAFERIINFFPEDRRAQLLMGLSQNVKGIISQRLIPKIDGKRVAAIEILLGTSLVEDMVVKGKFNQIKEVMEKSINLGMMTFDGSLYELYKQGLISLEEALRNSDAPNNLRLKISLEQGAIEPDKGLSLASKKSEVSDNDFLNGN